MCASFLKLFVFISYAFRRRWTVSVLNGWIEGSSRCVMYAMRRAGLLLVWTCAGGGDTMDDPLTSAIHVMNAGRLWTRALNGLVGAELVGAPVRQVCQRWVPEETRAAEENSHGIVCVLCAAQGTLFRLLKWYLIWSACHATVSQRLVSLLTFLSAYIIMTSSLILAFLFVFFRGFFVLPFRIFKIIIFSGDE